jgi:hypothetical protein
MLNERERELVGEQAVGSVGHGVFVVRVGHRQKSSSLSENSLRTQ